MAVMTQRTNMAPGLGTALGQGLVQGYEETQDRRTLQNAIQALPKDASPRDILQSMVGLNVSPEAKQTALKNLMGAAEFEEKKRQFNAQQVTNKAKEDEKARKAEEKKVAQTEEANLILEQSDLPQEQKELLKDKTTPASARSLLIASKSKEPTEYDIAKNVSKKYEPIIEDNVKAAQLAKRDMPLIENTILMNQKYGDNEKWWDTAIDSLNVPFLNMLKSKTGQQLEMYTPISVATFGTKMGGQMTNARQRLIEKKAVGLGRDKEANDMMLHMIMFDKKIDILRAQIEEEILGGNKYGLAPKDFTAKVDEKLKPYQEMMMHDIERLANGQAPDSPMSKLALQQQFQSQLRPGEVMVISPDGQPGALKETDLAKPEFKDYQRLRLP